MLRQSPPGSGGPVLTARHVLFALTKLYDQFRYSHSRVTLSPVQGAPWPGAQGTPALPSSRPLAPATEPSSKRLRSAPPAPAPGALALMAAPAGTSATTDIMAFFAQRADRTQGLEATIAALRDGHAQLSAKLAEREAEARAGRVRDNSTLNLP